MGIKTNLYLLAVIAMYLLLGMLLGSCSSRAQAALAQALSQASSLSQPDALSQGQDGEASAIDSTYWDDYDFYNVALIHQPDITEQRFANFCVALSKMSERERSRQVDTLLTRSLRGSRDMFANFMTLAEKYLYDPNSPYRNGELYLPFLQWTIHSSQIEDVWKERPRYQLKLVLENRVGTQAHDFHYITNGNASSDNTNAKGSRGIDANAAISVSNKGTDASGGSTKGSAKGKGSKDKGSKDKASNGNGSARGRGSNGTAVKGTLYGIKSEYTLIYFNNPECHDCGRVHGYLVASKVFTTMLQTGRLKLLALYPDEDLGSWTRHKDEYPSTWIAARYAKKADREYYHLPAIPSLYLLDKTKKVLLKDATVEAVEEYLRKVVEK